jgi:hypothetical protein
VRRREFITLLGGAEAWPVAARAQQSAMPVIGFVNPAPADGRRDLVAAFHQGLAGTGHVDARYSAPCAEYSCGRGRLAATGCRGRRYRQSPGRAANSYRSPAQTTKIMMAIMPNQS